MLLISHVAAGAVIGSAIPNLWVALPLSFASHFVLDTIPHAQAPTDEGYKPNHSTYFWVLLDVAAVFGYFYFYKPSLSVFLVILAAVLPDLLDLTRYNAFMYKSFKPCYDFHDRIQNETNKPIGFITQIILISTCLLLLGVFK
jgi:hypothetical protein